MKRIKKFAVIKPRLERKYLLTNINSFFCFVSDAAATAGLFF